MARVTVEDCLDRIPNRFELVLSATKRARQLTATGAEPHVPWENDKPTVVALREIADGHVDQEFMQNQELPVLEEEEEAAPPPPRMLGPDF